MWTYLQVVLCRVFCLLSDGFSHLWIWVYEAAANRNVSSPFTLKGWKFKISALSYYRTQNRIFHFYVAYQWCCLFRLCIFQKRLALIYDHGWEGWRVNKQFPKFWKHWSLNVSRCYWLIRCNNVITCHMTWSLLIHVGQGGGVDVLNILFDYQCVFLSVV